MASGSFNVTTSNGYISGTVSWSSSKDTANNQSTVTATMRLSRTNSGYTTYGTGDFYVTIDGTKILASNKDFTITQNSNTLMVSGSKVVKHNSDGSKKITIGWGGTSNVFNVNASSGSATLDTIPRASSITTSANWTAGNNLSVSISRASSSFVHSIYVYVNGVLIDNKGNIGTSTTFSWTTAENTEIFNQLNTKATEDTKILIITYEYAGGSEVGRKEYTGTVTAPSASTVTSGTDRYRYVDEDFLVGIARNNSSFTHTVRIAVGSLNFYRYNITTSATFAWTPSEAQQIYNQMPNANSIGCTIYITTYYNGEQVRGTTSINGGLYVRNSNPIFTTSNVHYEDINATTKAATGNNQYIVQNRSDLRVFVDTAATPQNGASITKYEFRIDGLLISTLTTTGYSTIGKLDETYDKDMTVKAIDSRGNSTTVTLKLKILQYSTPVINATAKRLNNFENQTTLTMKGSVASLMIGTTEKNAVIAGSVEYRYKAADTSTWGAWTDFTTTISGLTYTANNINLNLDNLKAWNIQVRISDKIDYRVIELLVNSGQPILFLDDLLKSVGVNKFPTKAGHFEVGGSIIAGNGTNYSEIVAERTVATDLYRMLMATGYSNGLAATYIAIVKNGTTVNSFRVNEDKTIDFNSNIIDGTGTLRMKKSGINSTFGYENWQGGFSYQALANEVGYPNAYGIVISFVDSAYRNIQFFSSKNVNDLWIRTWHDANANWLPWKKIAGEPDFIQASLASGWARYSNWALPGYYKDNDGFVHVQGMVQGGTLGSTIFTLGSAYVPRVSHGNHIFSMANATSPVEPSRIYIYTDGRVVWQAGGNSSWISLSGISFFAG